MTNQYMIETKKDLMSFARVFLHFSVIIIFSGCFAFLSNSYASTLIENADHTGANHAILENTVHASNAQEKALQEKSTRGDGIQERDAKEVAKSLAKAAKEGRKPSIYGTTFPSSFALYVFNPEILAGWNGPLRGYEKKWILKKYLDLPILGGWYGQGMIPDNEVIYKAQPDASFTIASMKKASDAERTMRKLGIPVIKIPGATLENDINLFRKLGIALNQEERGEELSHYAEEAFSRLSKALSPLKDKDRVRVYMSQGADGLETSCMGSARSVIIEAAGGINVNKCPDIMKDQFVQLSFENLIMLDPDVILVNNPSFMKKVKTDNRWQNLRAAKEHKIYNVPFEPFSWLDRPASFMRFIGVQWLAFKLHPDLFHEDLTQETKKFMKLFFRQEITDEQSLEILNP